MTSRPILPTPLVSTDWLANHLGDADLRVLDATAHLAGPESGSTVGWSLRPGRDDYLAAHIPGAAFADIIEDLSEPDGGALSKPSPARFAVAAGRLGIGPLSRVVVYAREVHWATRVWWLLRANGFDNVAVLDGGLRKWTAEGRPITTGADSYPGAEFVGEARPRFFAELEEVKKVVATGSGACLINSLSPQDHHAVETNNFARAGHIPGSLNVFMDALLNQADGTYKSVGELRKIFADVLSRPGRKVTYCGVGISATSDALALTLLGESDVAVYDGSLQEWTSHPELPLEVG
ncbi:rhodanese-related sulfurtransferase (plasmid) [Mycobacterium sp. JS623]|uniref:sulfurtransferase n=1 Tax=Mycobacterium sp. JS623 TaxID=212767 RepID=UPI0002A55FF3|nr:sulfurtransferase [Mycobacterium sp. JS623]AGB26924.1 rhodanese-related sulfurtransferase [Mycobacterium sp. JS623]